MKTKLFWIAGVLALVATVLTVRHVRASRSDVDPNLIVTVKRADLAIEVIETGKVQPLNKVEVKSKVAGQVEKVLVQEGELVKKGALLLKLDATDFRRDVAQRQADVAQRQADVAQAQNSLEYARLNLDRRQRGLEARGVSQADVDVATTELKAKTVSLRSAQVMLQGAQVALGASEDRLRYTQIVAPMDGTVIQRAIEPGEVVTPGVQATFEGKPLLTVANLGTLVVKTDLNQIDVAKVKLKQKVTLTLDALPGKIYEATISKVAAAATVPKDKPFDVFPTEATLSKSDGLIKPGMTADVRIHVETKGNILSVPIEALRKEKGKNYLTLITTQKQRQSKKEIEVETGVRSDREVEILSGIKEGDRVLVQPPSSAENEPKM